MLKPFFELLSEPLGLPIEWYYEYIILAVIGVIAYNIAYSKVGDMYRGSFIDGRTSGSFFHWLIRLIIFALGMRLTHEVTQIITLLPYTTLFRSYSSYILVPETALFKVERKNSNKKLANKKRLQPCVRSC